MKRFAAVLALGLGLAATACGGGQTRTNLFATEWTDDGGRSIERIRQRLRGTQPPPGADVVLGVAGNADRIVGMSLNGGNKWSFAHRIEGRPVVAGAVVIGTGSGELFALDAKTGSKLWARQTGGLPLRGAGDDGTLTVITLARAAGPGSTLLAIARDGSVTRQIETEKDLGVPAVVGGLAFVPWGNQYVSVFDVTNGDEPARVLLREKTSRAWTQNGTLYFGEIGIFRFDDRIALASRNQASHVGLPARELPGTPLLMSPAEERLGSVASARDKIRLYARPTGSEGPLAIDADRFYATYFKYVMGFEAQKGNLAWVHTHPVDVVGGAAAHGALVMCDEQGKITILDAAHGGSFGEQDLGEPIKSCVVSVDAWVPTGTPRSTGNLASQLAAAIEVKDAQLATAKRLLLREMAALDDELATKVLVDLIQDPSTSPLIVPDARAALAARRNGAQYMTAALQRHYDFLNDVLKPPPVGAIAQALAAMKEKSAAPLLASHLLDPADTDEDVKQAAAALAAIGDAQSLPAIKQFFALYHASAENEDIEAAVVSAAQAILQLGGKDGRALVEKAAADPMTTEGVKAKTQALLAGEKKNDKKDEKNDLPADPPKAEKAPAPTKK